MDNLSLKDTLDLFSFGKLLKPNIIITSHQVYYTSKLAELKRGYDYCLNVLRLNLDKAEGLGPIDLMDKLNALCNPKTKNYRNFELAKYIPTLPKHFFPEYKMEELERVCEGEEWELAKRNINDLCEALLMGKKILKNVYGLEFLGGDVWGQRLAFLDGAKIKNDDNYQYTKRYIDFLNSLNKEKGDTITKPK